MSLLPLGHSASSSEVYCEGINKPVTKVYSNRPAWVAPARSHFFSNFARQSPTLALVSTFGATLMAANMIVSVSTHGGASIRHASLHAHWVRLDHARGPSERLEASTQRSLLCSTHRRGRWGAGGRGRWFAKAALTRA